MTNRTSSGLPGQPKPNYSNLVEAIGGLIQSARSRVVQTINTEMVRLYWEIGRHIVEYEQGGSDRAKYGEALLKHLASDLTRQFDKGFSRQNLQNMRALYLAFPKCQAVPGKFPQGGKSQPVAAESDQNMKLQTLPAIMFLRSP